MSIIKEVENDDFMHNNEFKNGDKTGNQDVQERKHLPRVGSQRRYRESSPSRDQQNYQGRSPSQDERSNRERSPSQDYRERSPSRDHRNVRERSPSRDHRSYRERSPNRYHRSNRDLSPSQDRRSYGERSPSQDKRSYRERSPSQDQRKCQSSYEHSVKSRSEYKFKVPTVRKNSKKVCAFFNAVQGCKNGSNCNFAHDKDLISFKPTHQCPNPKCENTCIGKQCSECHIYQKLSKSTARRGHVSEKYSSDSKYYPKLEFKQTSYLQKQSSLKLCPQCNKNKCIGLRCRECHFYA